MAKFVFEYKWCVPYEASGTDVFIFESKDIDVLKYYLLEECDNAEKEERRYINFTQDKHVVICADSDYEDFKNQVNTNIYPLDEWVARKTIKW